MERESILLTASELAELFGVTIRWVNKLAERGIIERLGSPARYDLYEASHSYIKYLENKLPSELSAHDMESESKKINAEARIKKAKAEVAEMELQEMKKQYHKAEDVEEIMNDAILMLRLMLLELPGNLANDIANMENPAEVADIIKKKVYYCLNCMADYEYNEEEHIKRLQEYERWKQAEM